MWTKLTIEDGSFLLKRNADKDNLHRIQLTDFITLWFEDIYENALLKRCKELNRLLEASDEDLLANVFSLVESDKNEVSRSFICDEATPVNGKTLCVQSTLDGFKFRIKFHFKPASSKEFFENVTQPLLITISEMERRQHKLEEALRKKDVEINEYKLEGAQITRKTVETEPFDSESFHHKCSGEDLSRTKSIVTAQPCRVFSPGVQRLMMIIADAPILVAEDHLENVKTPEKKKVWTKLKSPIKNKKSKICFEGDEDEECIGSEEDLVADIEKKRSLEQKEEDVRAKTSRKKGKLKLFNL